MSWAAISIVGLIALYALHRARMAHRLVKRLDRDCYEMGRYVIDHMPNQNTQYDLVEADVGPLTEN
jgi:hypothetical protein